ncbi:MAG: 50S ribosomal protein L9 [Bacilli bacterium]|jgi:ribosomal protein L9|nr:50S ribosomal protein L9 [Bacillota bacterium]NLM32339.1 50S ribosomal protein L9 [Acholeplasmataceae bacterium]HOA77833.1 50S ribosomal protein L9 [Bacilli bacterium]HPZ26661.1 50S ribosomal protein L9 [Bacilli bacterium]HQC88933.1 50S ribosomal protein L9 [Bacilli bacterium]
MKMKLPIQKIIIVLFCLATFLFVYSFIDENFHVSISYISLSVIVASLTYFYMIGKANRNIKRLRWLENRLKLWNLISYRVKKAGEYAFNHLPIGIIIYNEEKVIEWANAYAKEIFMSPLVDRKIEIINPELFDKINGEENFEMTIYGRHYRCNVISDHNILYFLDQTDLKDLQQKYRRSLLAVGFLNLDNLDTALTALDAQERAMQMSNLIGLLSDWSNKHDIYLRGLSEARYLLFMTFAQLRELMDDKFSVLDDIQNYCQKEDLRITASLGIACKDDGITRLVELAEEQLELALNRGGNQGVVLIDNQIHYFGAKTTSLETRSPIFVRVKAEMLADMIKHSRDVLIMSHKDMDADAFGSCLAIHKIVAALKKESKIVFDESSVDETIRAIHNIIQKEHINILDYFVAPRKAVDNITNDTLLVIVDCQYQTLLTSEKLYKSANKIAIIDHHRRNNNAISNYDYLYSQSSASSTVELVAEMFQYISNEIEISEIEATWMLMGILVDTNNLMYRTSYRTFNVLAVLQKIGAEIPRAQRYLRENFGEYVKRMSILNNLEIVDGKYAIAACSADEIYSRAFLAKIADNIISVHDIKASFCIGRIDENEIGISARSLNEVNVQVIMEQLNGGGHFNNAATQIKDVTVEQAKEMLIDKLSRLEDGGMTTMKIILTKDVKGKGKAGDIIDIPAGHANFLIRTDQAVLATVDNIKQLEKKKREEKEAMEKHLNEMRELKSVIESKPVHIHVRVGKEGKLFGSVSTKQIADEFKAQHDLILDKRKMLPDKIINSLGTYEIPIQLHKEVTALMTIHVVEKK